MATSKFALAITTGRPKGEDPNALKICNIIYQNLICLTTTTTTEVTRYWCVMCVSIVNSNVPSSISTYRRKCVATLHKFKYYKH
jgi:hypothetical protein